MYDFFYGPTVPEINYSSSSSWKVYELLSESEAKIPYLYTNNDENKDMAIIWLCN